MSNRFPLGRHQLTERALDLLRLLQPGQTISWAEMSAGLGVDARFEGRSYIWKARQILLKEGAVLHADPHTWGDGVHRLTDAEIAEVVPNLRRKKMRRQATREMRELRTVRVGILSRDLQAAITQAKAAAGTILHFTDFHFTETQRRQIKLNDPPPLPPPINQ